MVEGGWAGSISPSRRQSPPESPADPALSTRSPTTAHPPNHSSEPPFVRRKACALAPRLSPTTPPETPVRDAHADTIGAESIATEASRTRTVAGARERGSAWGARFELEMVNRSLLAHRTEPIPRQFRAPPARYLVRPVQPELPQRRVSRALSLPDEVCARIAPGAPARALAPRRSGRVVLAGVQGVLGVQSETHEGVRRCVGWCAGEQRTDRPWRPTSTRLSLARAQEGSLGPSVLRDRTRRLPERFERTRARCGRLSRDPLDSLDASLRCLPSRGSLRSPDLLQRLSRSA